MQTQQITPILAVTFISFYVYGCFACMCVYTVCVQDTWGSQKREPGFAGQSHVNLTQTSVIWKEGTLIEQIPP